MNIQMQKNNCFKNQCITKEENIIHVYDYNNKIIMKDYKGSAKNLMNFQITHHFEDNMLDISRLFEKLNRTTADLEQKIDHLLEDQKLQFFNSYKIHMNTIKEYVNSQNKLIAEKQLEIRYYKEQSNLSKEIIKSKKLEQENANLYKVLKEKQKMIQDYKLKIKLIQRDIIKYKQQKKFSYRENIFQSTKKKQNQLIDKNYNTVLVKKKTELHTQPASLEFITMVKEDITCNNNTNFEKCNNNIKSLKKELKQLRNNYEKILKQKVQLFDTKNEMENIFFECIKQVQRTICIKKKLNYCTFQEFKRQDKINILYLLVCNDAVISILYRLIFSPNKNLISINNQIISAQIKGSHEKGSKSVNNYPLNNRQDEKLNPLPNINITTIVKLRQNLKTEKYIKSRQY